MTVSESYFLFELFLENAKSLIEGKKITIRTNFSDVFSLDIMDSKQPNIVMPQLPPPPPEPYWIRKSKAKDKSEKSKEGIPHPLEPVIQSEGQSVLIASSGEFLLTSMKNNPLTLSLFEGDVRFLGSTNLTWDQQYFEFLGRVCQFEKPQPVTVKGEFNIFGEETANVIVTVTLKIKLSYFENMTTSQLRSATNLLVTGTKKRLHIPIHSENKPYMCNSKISEQIEEDNVFTLKDEPTPYTRSDFVIEQDIKHKKHAANITLFSDDTDYCCMIKTEKAPVSTKTSPKVTTNLNDIVDDESEVIRSCNQYLRMLTPQLETRPRQRATDIDRLGGCNHNRPDGKLTNFVKYSQMQRLPYAMCSEPDERAHSFQFSNKQGPFGLAQELREYIQNVTIEDKKEVMIDNIVGPYNTAVHAITDRFENGIRPVGVFSSDGTAEGLSTIFCTYQNKLKESFDLDISKNHDYDIISSCLSKSCLYNNEANNIYCVGYCTIVNNISISNYPNGQDVDNDHVENDENTDNSQEDVCKTECPGLTKKYCSKDVCDAPSRNETLCTPDDECTDTCGPLNKKPFICENDSDIEINLRDIKNPCSIKSCDIVEKLKDFLIEGALKLRTKKTEDEFCFCNCECKFGFGQKTTYCAVCGGYEVEGTDLKELPPFSMPVPACPIYHKQYDENKFKLNPLWDDPMNQQNLKTSEEAKLNIPKIFKANESSSKATIVLPGFTGKPGFNKIEKANGKDTYEGEKKVAGIKSDNEALVKGRNIDYKPDSDNKGKHGKEMVGKLTGNYGFKRNATKIGQCRSRSPHNARAAKAGISTVPKHMGWLWNAEDIPGMKFRPGWRPGAVQKALFLKYRRVRGQIDEQAKKRKGKDLLKRIRSKKEIKKPALIVNKAKGEYTVQMEVMKTFSHGRLPFQYPYDDKPPLVFTVGRTEQENEKRKIKLERRERRERRRKNKYMQSEFRNMCEEICLKKYQEAIGILPKPDPYYPSCPCFLDKLDRTSLTVDSCSCENRTSSGSNTETDEDDWVIEFTPPNAKYNPNAERPRHGVETESQYNYLDYKVKLAEWKGTPVPRYFTGPDGQQVCSDLGGFFGPNGNWLEIGKDGYIGVDGRWVPMGFIGPDGSFINAEDGFFVDSNGRKFVIGVDGYIGKDGKWIFYPPGPKSSNKINKSAITDPTSGWTCLPKISPSKVGFKPHGTDRLALQERLNDRMRIDGSTDNKMPKGKVVPRFRAGKIMELGQSDLASKATRSKLSIVTMSYKDTSKVRDKGIGVDSTRKTRYTVESGLGRISAPAPVNTYQPAAAAESKKDKASAVRRPSKMQFTTKDPDIEETGDNVRLLSDKRVKALAFLKDKKNKLEDKKICKLGRMAADGRHISGSHKECFKQATGDCCEEQQGICTEIFKLSHDM